MDFAVEPAEVNAYPSRGFPPSTKPMTVNFVVAAERRRKARITSGEGDEAPRDRQTWFGVGGALTSGSDRVHTFNADGFDSLDPKYAGGRPAKFTLPERQQIKRIALSRPQDHHLPFSTWSLSKLAEFVVAEGVVDDISHEGLRTLLREEGVSFQVIKTFKASNDPDFEAKKNRIPELYAIADGTVDRLQRTRSRARWPAVSGDVGREWPCRQ